MIAPGGAACSSFNGNSLAAPSSVAIDGFGNVFVANQTTATIVELSGSGALLSTTPYSGGGLNQPSAIAINAR
jgi:hypothetical protein